MLMLRGRNSEIGLSSFDQTCIQWYTSNSSNSAEQSCHSKTIAAHHTDVNQFTKEVNKACALLILLPHFLFDLQSPCQVVSNSMAIKTSDSMDHLISNATWPHYDWWWSQTDDDDVYCLLLITLQNDNILLIQTGNDCTILTTQHVLDLCRVKSWHHNTASSTPHWSHQGIHIAMHMMQW